MTSTGPVPSPGVGLDHMTARYVERGGEVVRRQPFVAKDVRLHGFALQAHHDNLARLLYRSFTEPSGGRVILEPLGHCVLLAFMTTPTLRSSEPPDSTLGSGHESEVAIWVPTIDRKTGTRHWVLPYMFVDQFAAQACGRETYGFPKQEATIAIDGGDPPVSLRVQTPTIEVYHPDARIAVHEVITVTRTPTVQTPTLQWGSPSELGQQLLDASGSAATGTGIVGKLKSTVNNALAAATDSSLAFADASEIAALLFDGFVDGNLPVLLLKQFRSCEDPTAACYQAIVRVELKITECRQAASLPEDYTVAIAKLDGNPLVADLGLPETIHPKIGFTMDFDFAIPRGKVVWSTSSPGW